MHSHVASSFAFHEFIKPFRRCFLGVDCTTLLFWWRWAVEWTYYIGVDVWGTANPLQPANCINSMEELYFGYHCAHSNATCKHRPGECGWLGLDWQWPERDIFASISVRIWNYFAKANIWWCACPAALLAHTWVASPIRSYKFCRTHCKHLTMSWSW